LSEVVSELKARRWTGLASDWERIEPSLEDLSG
jgi:hypothetical protein